MILQAVIDDSGNEPNQKVYVLGGFLAPQDRWAAFTDAWQAELDKPNPSKLAFYKFRQSRFLKGQFCETRGWTDELRDERVQALARIAADHALQRFEVSLRHEHFERYVRSVPIFEPKLLSHHPYLFMALHVVSTVATIAILENLTEQIDFIFDEQTGFQSELQALWDGHKDMSSPWGRPNIGRLIFDKDEDFLPLQAADMWAGCVRHGLMTNEALPETNILGINLPGLSEHMSGEDLRQFGLRLLAEAERRSAAEPDRPLVVYDKKTAKHARWKARTPKPDKQKKKKKARKKDD